MTGPRGSQPGVPHPAPAGPGTGSLVARSVRSWLISTSPIAGKLPLGLQNKEGTSVPEGAVACRTATLGSRRCRPLCFTTDPRRGGVEALRGWGRWSGSRGRESVYCGRRAELQHSVVCFLLGIPEREGEAPRSGAPAPPPTRVCSSPRAPLGAGRADSYCLHLRSYPTRSSPSSGRCSSGSSC